MGVPPTREGAPMPETFRRGERVEWNFRGHPVTGKVKRKLTKRTEVAGRPVAASADDPRYLVGACAPCNQAIGEPGRRGDPPNVAVTRW